MVPEVSDITAVFRLPSSIGEPVLTGPKYAANKTLRRLVGATAMDTADAVNVSQQAADQGTHEVLKLAGAYFAMYYAAPVVAARIRTDGQVITESGEVQKTLRYATAKEMEDYRQSLWNSAISILESVDDLLTVEAENEYVSDQRTWQIERAAPYDNLTYPSTTTERVM